MTDDRRRVAVIAIDGADPATLHRYVDEGAMPAIGELIQRSREIEVHTRTDVFSGSPWPDFASGVAFENHGLHAFRPIRNGTLETVEADDFKPPTPFWERAVAAGLRAAVADVPYCAPPEADAELDGLSVLEWGPFPSLRTPGAFPRDVGDELLARHAPYPFHNQEVLTAADVGPLTAELCDSARVRGEIFRDLFTRDAPDVMVGVFCEPHPATHQCQVLEVPDHACRDALAGSEIEQPIREVFRAVDAAIGKLIASLGPGTTVLLMCLNGMRPSYGGAQLLGDVLTRLELSVPARGIRARKRYRDFVPQPVRTVLHQVTPPRIRAENVHRSLAAMFDWSATRAFSLPWVYGGYLRVNLRGREPRGIVEPGAEYAALLDRVETEVRALRVVGTDAPAVAEIIRPHERFPGRAVDQLPDMMVIWNNHRPIEAVESPSLGVIKNGEPGRHGSHTAEAGMFASGPGIQAGPPIADAWDIDIAPTVLALLGIAPSEELDGKPIAELLSPIGG